MKRAFFVLLLSATIGAAVAHAQPPGSRQILVFGDSTSTYGRLLSISSDTLQLLTTRGREGIPRQAVRRVIVRADVPQDAGVRYGLLLGGYASLYLLGTDNETGTFMHRRLANETGTVFLALIPGMAVGAAVGFLVDRQAGGRERVFEMSDPPSDWERMAAYLGPPDPGTVHIAIQAAAVDGLEFDDRSFGGYGAESEASRFNVARKIQCTYSVTPKLELGLAFCPTGKLSLQRYRYESPAPLESRNYSLSRSLKLTSTFAVAQYSLLRGTSPSGIELKAGAGIGLTAVDYRRSIDGSIYRYDSARSSVTTLGPFHHNVSRKELSGLIFAELSIRVSDGLSLGLVVDRIFLKDIEDPGEAAASSRPTAATPSTWGLGVQVGIHL